jgi:hypothetical protein
MPRSSNYKFSSLTCHMRHIRSILTGTLLSLGLSASVLPSLAQANEASAPDRLAQAPTPASTVSNLVNRSPIPDGVYLYGQTAEPEQMGSAYMVFEVSQNQVVGAFYMPNSSFDCFQGEFQGSALAVNITDSYAQEVYPYEVALESDATVAQVGEGAIAPIGLEGYHHIETVSDNDQRILAVCQADFQQ